MTFAVTAATTVVRVANNAFVPSGASVSAGDSVAWQWQGVTSAHNITFTLATGAPADEPDRASGVVWRTFGIAGPFDYRCTNHPGMMGTITVNP